MPLYRQTKSQELSTEIINCITGGKKCNRNKIQSQKLQNTKDRHKTAEETKLGTREVTATLYLRHFKKLKTSLNKCHTAKNTRY